tara:strand:- start:2319 stop:6926 length:4608 start_codon:yes stop_codon:yes gene_type:complete
MVEVTDPFATGKNTVEVTDPFATGENTVEVKDPYASMLKTTGKEDDENRLADTFRGAAYAIPSMVQGLSETGAGLFDLTFGTDSLNDVSEFYNWALEPLKPRTGYGKTAAVGVEVVASFIPFFGWASRANRAAVAAKTGTKLLNPAKSAWHKSAEAYGRSKAGQAMLSSSRAKRYAATGAPAALYTGAVESIFAPDGRTTISDNFDVLPDFLETEQYNGETKRENAARLFRNKGRRFAEGAGASVAFDAGLFGLTSGARGLAYVPGAAGTARVLRDLSDYTGRRVAESMVANSAPVKNTAQFMKRWLTPDGGADPILAKALRDMEDSTDGLQRGFVTSMNELHDATNNVLLKTRFWKRDKAGAKELNEDLDAFNRGLYVNRNGETLYLGQDTEKGIENFTSLHGAAATKAAAKMITARLKLEDELFVALEKRIQIMEPGTPSYIVAKEARDIIEESNKLGEVYIRRMFEAKENPVKFLKHFNIDDPQYAKAVDEVAGHLQKKYPNMGEEKLNAEATSVVNETIHLGALKTGDDPKIAIKNVIDSFETQRKFSLKAPTSPKFSIGEDIFIKRKDIIDDSAELRKLLGERTDPMETSLRTYSDMAKTYSAIKFYNTIAKNPSFAVPAGKAVDLIAKGSRPPIALLPSRAFLDDIEKRSGLSGISSPKTRGREGYEKFARDMANSPDSTTMEKAYYELEASRVSGMSDEKFAPELKKRIYNETAPALKEIQKLEADLARKNYTRLGETPSDKLFESQTIFGGKHGDLEGQWVSPETYNAMNTSLNLSPFVGAIGMFQQLRAFSQKMAIVPSPGTQIRNIVGGQVMLFMGGNMQRNLAPVETLQIFMRSIDNLDDEGLRHRAKILNASGLLDSSVIYKTLKEYQAFGRGDSRLGTATGKVLDTMEEFIPFMKQFEKLYANSDAYFKSIAFDGEYNKLYSAIAKTGIDPEGGEAYMLLQTLFNKGVVAKPSGLLEGLSPLETAAAEIVKDIMPMYNRVAPAMRVLDRLPVLGNFTSFASENVRNSYNLLERGLKEVSFEIPAKTKAELIERLTSQESDRAFLQGGQEAVDALQGRITKGLNDFERTIRANGAQRLTNSAMGAVVIPKALTQMSMDMTGTTEEQAQGVQDSLQEYATGADLFYLTNDQKGRITAVDLNYHNPYGYLTGAATSALRIYNQQGRLGKDEATQIANSSMDFLTKIADPFASETLIYERMRNALPKEGIQSLGVGRGGVSATGAKIWHEGEPLGTKMIKGIAHVVEGVAPRYFTEIYEEKAGKIVPGKIYRSLTGMTNRSGTTEYDPMEQGARLLTGLTPMEYNLNETFNYAGTEYAMMRSDAKNIFSGDIKAADLTADQMVTSFEDYIKSALNIQNQLFGKIQAARKTGVSDKNIVLSLIKESKLGKEEAAYLMKGQFFLKGVQEDMMKDMAWRNKQEKIEPMADVPVERINDLVRQYLATPLTSDRSLKDTSGIMPSLSPDIAPASVPVVDPYQQMFKTTPVPVVDPYQQMFKTTPTTPTGKVNPILLGGDPATQALADHLGR